MEEEKVQPQVREFDLSEGHAAAQEVRLIYDQNDKTYKPAQEKQNGYVQEI